MAKEVASVYLHIGNGGVTFSVVDEGYGPVVKIRSISLGTNVISQEIHVSNDELAALSKMFDYASKKYYSEYYCNHAQVEEVSPYGLLGEDFELERESRHNACGQTAQGGD
jgi:hypothetical protein